MTPVGQASGATDSGARDRLVSLWWIPPLLLVAFAYRDSPTFDLVADARFLIRENLFVQDVSRLWQNVVHDYFWSSSGNGIPYWRPFTKASWVVEYALFGGWAGGYHAVQVAWHLAGCGGVALLARRLGAGRTAAAFAALLYGLHPALIEPVCLVMARSDVVVAAASVWAVLGFVEWRRTGRIAWAAAHVASVAVALASKEAGVVLAPVVVLFALLDGDARAGRRRRLLTVAPTLVLAAAYLGLRRIVLGPSDAPEVAVDPLRIFAGLGAYLSGILPLRLDPVVRNVPIAEASSPAFLAGAAVAWSGAAAIVARLAWRREGSRLALVGWALLSLAPVLVVARIHVPNVEGKLPLADRWTAQAVAATSVLACLFADGVRSTLVRRGLAGVAGAWVLLALVRSGPLHASYASELALVELEERVHRDTPAAFRTGTDACQAADREIVRALSRGDTAAVESLAAALPPACRGRGFAKFNDLSALVRAGRYADARPLLDELLADPPGDARTRVPLVYLGGIVRLGTGDPQGAERLLLEAQRLGLETCNLPLKLAQAAAAQDHASDAAARFEETAACAQRTGSPAEAQALLGAAFWHVRAGNGARSIELIGDVLRRFELSEDDRRQAALIADQARRGPAAP